MLVTTSFPIRGDGSEAAGSFVSDLVKELVRHCPVRVVAPGRSVGREAWVDGVDVFRFAAPEQALSTLKPWRFSDLLQIWQVLGSGERATRSAVLAGPTSKILALWALPSGHWARRVSRTTGVPYAVWTLGSDIWTLGRIPVLRSYLRKVLRDARTCWSDGVKLAADTERIGSRAVNFLASTRRIEGSRTAALRTSPPYRFLFLGRWHRNKGVDLLLEALDLLDETAWERIEEVVIAGGGPLLRQVEDSCRSLVARGRPVTMLGYLDKEAAEQRIIACDFLVIPSRIESIPVVFSDAMKLGAPVICTPVGDLGEMVGRSPASGIVSVSCAPRDIAAALTRALSGSPAAFQDGIEDRQPAFDLRTIAVQLIGG